MNYYQIREGKLPVQKNEIALPENIIELLGDNIKPGDRIHLPMKVSLMKDTEEPWQYTQDFILTGVISSNYISYVSGTVDGIVGDKTADGLLPSKYMVYSVDVRTKEKGTFQNVIYSLEEQYKIPDSQVQYNDTLLSAMNIKYDSGTENDFAGGFSYMTLAGALIGILVLFAAGLVVYNILKISVGNEIRNYGILRAIGANKRKLYELVSLKIIYLCGIGIPVGAAGGILSANGITKAVTRFFNPQILWLTPNGR